MDADREWAARRDRAVAAYAADLARREAAEAARAAGLFREFVAAARERGLAGAPDGPVVRRPRPVPDEAARLDGLLLPARGPPPRRRPPRQIRKRCADTTYLRIVIGSDPRQALATDASGQRRWGDQPLPRSRRCTRATTWPTLPRASTPESPAWFLHHISRDGDPHLHVHVAVCNRVRRTDQADEKWRTLDSRSLHNQRLAVAPVTDRGVETRALGYAMVPRPDGNGAEVGGVSQDVMDLFSSRSRALTPELKALIGQYQKIHGKPPSKRTIWLLGRHCAAEHPAHQGRS